MHLRHSDESVEAVNKYRKQRRILAPGSQSRAQQSIPLLIIAQTQLSNSFLARGHPDYPKRISRGDKHRRDVSLIKP